MRLRRFIFVLAVVTMPLVAYNRTDASFARVSTAHYRVFYDESVEEIAFRATSLAEEIYTNYMALFPLDDEITIHLIISDREESGNGYADYRNNVVYISVRDLYETHFIQRGRTDWLLNVLLHELGHIFTLRYYASALDFIPAIMLGGGSVTDDGLFQYGADFFFAQAGIPMWFAEGIAQYLSDRFGGDAYGTYRMMLLTAFADEGKMLNKTEMASFGYKGVWQSERVYNQGYALLRFLHDTYGEDVAELVFERIRDNRGFNFHMGLKRALGVSFNDFFAKWTNSVMNDVRARRERVGTCVRGSVVFEGDRFAFSPKRQGDTYAVFAGVKNDYFADTVLLMRGGFDAAPFTRIEDVVAYDLANDGDAVFYVSGKDGRPGRPYYRDVYRYDVRTKRHQRLSTNARYERVAVAPDETALLLVQYTNGRKDIVRLNLTTMEQTRVATGDVGVTHFSPVFTEKGCAYLRFKDGVYTLFAQEGGDTRALIRTTNELRDLYASSAGTFFLVADVGGIFNVYHVAQNDGTLTRVNNVFTGSFTPFYDEQAKALYYARFSANGVSIHALPKDAFTATPVAYETHAPGDEPRMPHEPIRTRALPAFTSADKNHAFRLTLPALYPAITLSDGKLGGSGTLIIGDVLGEQSVSIAGGGNQEGNGNIGISYATSMFLFDVGASYRFSRNKQIIPVSVGARNVLPFTTRATPPAQAPSLSHNAVYIFFPITFVIDYRYNVFSSYLTFAHKTTSLTFEYNFIATDIDPEDFLDAYYYADDASASPLWRRHTAGVSFFTYTIDYRMGSDMLPVGHAFYAAASYNNSRADAYFFRTALYLDEAYVTRAYTYFFANYTGYFRVSDRAGGNVRVMGALLTHDVADFEELSVGGGYTSTGGEVVRFSLLSGYPAGHATGEALVDVNASFLFELFYIPVEALFISLDSVWLGIDVEFAGVYKRETLRAYTKGVSAGDAAARFFDDVYGDVSAQLTILGRLYHIYAFHSFFRVSFPLNQVKDMTFEQMRRNRPRYYLGIGTGF